MAHIPSTRMLLGTGLIMTSLEMYYCITFAVWVWLYDVNHYWMERMPTIHSMSLMLCHFIMTLSSLVGLAKHLIATRSQDVNSKGGHRVGLIMMKFATMPWQSTVTPLHAQAGR